MPHAGRHEALLLVRRPEEIFPLILNYLPHQYTVKDLAFYHPLLQVGYRYNIVARSAAVKKI